MLKNDYKDKIISIISIIFLLLTLILANKIFNKSSKLDSNYNNITNNTYYEVNLLPNNYYSNNILNENNYYIANSIKTIDIYFKYNFNDNNIYYYDINTTLKSYADNGCKLVFEKNFNLENTHNIIDNELEINKYYSIDYNYYLNYINSFQKFYNIKTDTYLYVNFNIYHNNEVIFSNNITIPINNDIIEITMDEDKKESINKDNSFNKKIIFSILVVSLILISIKINLKKKKNDYNLLKDYPDLVIILKNKPSLNNNALYLSSLKDLINLAINYNIRILNYQNIYYVIIDNTYYVYLEKDIKNK